MTRLFREPGEGLSFCRPWQELIAEVDGARRKGSLGAGATSDAATPVIGAPVFGETSGYRSNCDPRGVLGYTASRISGAQYYIGVGKGVQRATATDVAPDGLQLRYASAP